MLDTDLVNGVHRESGEEEEEELITAEKVLENLEIAWTNEISAPDILFHPTDLIDLMLGQVAHMEENMHDLDKSDVRFVVHQMELERIRYIMANYMRCRLQKIENYTQHILNGESAEEIHGRRLSPEETVFAQDYLKLQEQHLNTMALQYMPNIQRAECEQHIVRPNIMSHVFIKANCSVPAVVVDANDEEVDLAVGSQHIILYQLVADLILNQKAQLL